MGSMKDQRISDAMPGALYRAVKAASPRAFVEQPYASTTSIIDGSFDWAVISRNLQRELQEEGFLIVAASKEV